MNSSGLALGEVAVLVGGRLIGDGKVSIIAARPLSEAGPRDLTFLESEKHLRQLEARRPAAVIARPGQAPPDLPAIECEDPLGSFLIIFKKLHGLPEQPPHGIDGRAAIHPSAKLGADVSIHPFASIGEGSIIGDRCRILPGAVIGRHCRLGDDVTLHPHAVLYDGSVLGNRVTIHANAVIGADGFGYRLVQGRHAKVPHYGNVEIGDDVEIGACTTIDRGTFQPTRIGEGTKIDNQVMVAHNCQIGKHNLLVSQSGIAGSSTTGSYVVLAGQAGVADHVHLGDGVMVGAKAGIMGDVPPGQRMLGVPARPEREAKTLYLNTERIPDLRRDVEKLKEKVGVK